MLLRGSRDPKICSWSQSNVFMCHFVHKPYNERFCSFQTLPAQVPNVFAVLILCRLRVQDPRPGTATGHGKCACACARRAELPTEAEEEDRPPRQAARVSSSSPSPGRPLGSRHRVRAQRWVLVLSLRGWNALSPTSVSRLRTSDAAAGACRARASGSGPGWQARPPGPAPGAPFPGASRAVPSTQRLHRRDQSARVPSASWFFSRCGHIFLGCSDCTRAAQSARVAAPFSALSFPSLFPSVCVLTAHLLHVVALNVSSPQPLGYGTGAGWWPVRHRAAEQEVSGR